MDKIKTINDQIKQFVNERNWDKFHTPANLAKSISIEANELLECFQWDEQNFNLDDVKDELADVFTYCFQLADKLDVDIYQIIIDKMQKNIVKYPIDKCKGKANKYDKL